MTGSPFFQNRQTAYIDSLEQIIEEKDEEISDLEDEIDDNDMDDEDDVDYWESD